MADWIKAASGKAAACHYGCGKPATMTEPGKPWKAHKVCAEGDVGAAGSRPLGTFVEDNSHAEDGPYGCGTSVDPVVMGRVCGAVGDVLACQLCPRSPSYWRSPAEGSA